METQIKIFEKRSNEIVSFVDSLIIKNQEDVNSASDCIKTIKDLQKEVIKEKEEYTNPAKEIIEKAKSVYDPIINICKEFEIILKTKAQTYLIEERKKADEERLKIAQKVETGYIKPETAVAKMEAIKEVDKTTKTENSSLTLKMGRDIEIIDESKIPEEYFMRVLDRVKLKKEALAGKEIPGIKVVDKPIMSSSK